MVHSKPESGRQRPVRFGFPQTRDTGQMALPLRHHSGHFSR